LLVSHLCIIRGNALRFEFFTAVNMKSAAFSDVTQCSLYRN
jgi:hypothetical protein